MKNFVTCHCHQQSLDTASTPEAFAAREGELGTGFLTITDHGTLQAARKIYDLGKKKGLTPIIGLEAYLRDDDCPILLASGAQKDANGTLMEYAKYFHITMHFKNAHAYETAVRLLSKADARAEKHGQERKPLFTWSDLEELGGTDTTMTSSCLVGVVQRHLVAQDNLDNAEAYYQRLRGICKPGNWYAEVFPHICDKNWDSAVFATYSDGSTEKFVTWKKLKFSDDTDARADELAKRWTPSHAGRELVATMEQRKWKDREPKRLMKLELREGFIQNDCRPWAEDGDLQRGANEAILYLADKYGDPILIGDDSHYAKPNEKVVQDIRLQASGGSWRFYGHYHRQSSEEAFGYFSSRLGIDRSQFESWVENSYAWADGFKGFKFKERKSLPTKFYPEDTLGHTMALIEKHGRMQWENPVWVERLEQEIELLYQNGAIDLLPYFMIDEEVCSEYAKRKRLTGPGRGSAAGLLLAYLLRITHVDPIRYGLSKERFLTASRIRSGKLPDIDQDLPDRELLVDPEKGWLKERFGDHYAQISTDTTLKLRSSVKDVARVLHGGRVPDEIEALTKRFQNAPQGISDYEFVFGYKGSDGWVAGSIESDVALKDYIARYPQEWEIVQKCLGLPRQKSRHACAYVIANEPITNFIPTTSVSDVTVTQFTAPSVEAVGGLKMDFLIINSLKDIEDCIKLVQERSGLSIEDSIINNEKVLAHEIVPFKGQLYSIWKLPEDQAVFRDFCEGKTETVFQFNTPGALGWLKHFDHVKETRPDGTVVKALDSIEALAAFTALDRPGPLDYFVETTDGNRHNMLVEYAIRARGGEATGALPVLNELLPETLGVIVYQEQLQKVFQRVGQTTAEEADEFRVHISKKKMSDVIKDKAIFMPGAVKTLGEEVANELWNSMETFGQYGFNKSHSVCYVTISYACAFLKHHFPLEWWTAVLRHADKDEINTKFWKHCGHLIDLPDVALSGDQFEIRDGRIRAPLSLLHGVGEGAHAQLTMYRPYAGLDDFCQKIVAHKINGTKQVEVLNKKTGQKEMKTRVGSSALNKSVVATLVISGAMQSFFPPDTLDVDALALYNEAMARAMGKKRPEKVDKKYLTLNSFTKLQMRKAILPAYMEPIEPLILRSKHQGIQPGYLEDPNGRPEFKINGRTAPFVDLGELEYIANRKPWPDDYVVTVAAAAYIVEARKFSYGAGKEAMELTVDLDGGRFAAVKWPGKTGRLPDHMRSPADIKGAVAVVFYTKYNEERPFVVEDLAVIQPPLDHTSEQSPDPE